MRVLLFISVFPKTTVSTLLSVIIFTGRPLPPPPLRVLEVHINGIRDISIYITESKIHISYLKPQDLKLMLSSIIFTCQPFQPSSISLLRVGNNFSISSPFDVTKLQKIVLMSHQLAAFHSQCQWTCIFLSLTNTMAMRTQLGFKRH
jgi:hypothetical protein